MVIIELKGGLGNQLFQYAAGTALAAFHQTELKVDVSNLKSPDETLGTYRRYVLKHLEQPPIIANEKDMAFAANKMLNRLMYPLPTKLKPTYKEKGFHYHASFWETGSNVYLKGNFQSDKYFGESASLIKDKLQLNVNALLDESKSLLTEISGTNSLSIHVRRGDYVSNKIANDVLGALPIEFYVEAYKAVMASKTIDRVFVFSDDIQWAKKNFSFVQGIFFVDVNDTNKDVAEFFLMQHCKHNIIANSSFSWWAAYLNPNPNKIVIAPKQWFNKAPYDTKDLYPDGWIKI